MTGLKDERLAIVHFLRMNNCKQLYRRGQTMTECALILASVVIIVFFAYQTMGSTIRTLASFL
jgi:hypothetical protein